MNETTEFDAPSGVGVDAVVSLPPIAVDALRSAAHEFVDEHGWSIDGETGVPEPFEETLFFVVLAKHIGFLLDADAYKTARIEALKTELRVLEG
jgi:hypothetical protein